MPRNTTPDMMVFYKEVDTCSVDAFTQEELQHRERIRLAAQHVGHVMIAGSQAFVASEMDRLAAEPTCFSAVIVEVPGCHHHAIVRLYRKGEKYLALIGGRIIVCQHTS